MNPRDPSGGAYVAPEQWELGAQVETHPLVIAAVARAAAAEREACAALCDAAARSARDSLGDCWYPSDYRDARAADRYAAAVDVAGDLAAAIRARGAGGAA